MSAVEILLLAARLLGLFGILAGVVLSLTWLERKTLARIQLRVGPSLAGPHGTLQPIADAVKLVTKEDLTPAGSDKLLFWAAPMLVFVPAFLVWVVIPFGAGEAMVVRALDLGLLYLVAITSLGVVGLLMAGWASGGRYSMLGGLRAAAQLVSYEIPIVITILAVAVLVQSLSLDAVINGNTVTVGDRVFELPGQNAIPFALVMPLGAVIFFTAGLAEIGRTPFDIHHAESEVVGGPFLEYSGAHWAAFFLAEYLSTFVLAALTAVLFFGGWSWPNPPESIFGTELPGAATTGIGVVWFVFKAYLLSAVIFWIRGTFPRLRIDQLMTLAWQGLIPLAFVNLFLAAATVYYQWPWWGLTLVSLPPLAGAAFVIRRRRRGPARGLTVTVYRKVTSESGRVVLAAPPGSAAGERSA
ncbi:MAG: complex I subunit 1 family protein [Dehalococcoidia bacterium]